MNDFLEKWKSDKKYRTKIKLIAYTAFVVIVSVYAISASNNLPSNTSIFEDYQIENNEDVTNTIDIPTNYTYKITVNIDDTIYTYNGQKTVGEETIQKESNGVITNYRYDNNEYYVLIDDAYQLTTKTEVYDTVNYNYLNLENINKYLSKAEKNNNDYSVYLKDIILGNDSNDSFIISINNNYISIDYTPLIKEFDPSINKYLVDIIIEKK